MAYNVIEVNAEEIDVAGNLAEMIADHFGTDTLAKIKGEIEAMHQRGDTDSAPVARLAETLEKAIDRRLDEERNRQAKAQRPLTMSDIPANHPDPEGARQMLARANGETWSASSGAVPLGYFFR